MEATTRIMSKIVQVRAPATSANLGPGFDCLGLALGLYLDITATEQEGTGLEIVARGEGRGQVPLDQNNAVYKGLVRACAEVGRAPRRIALEIASDIPLASGLGSSSAALVAGLAAGAALCGETPDREDLLRWGVAMEGHPDNVAPCVMGGIVIAALDGGEVISARIDPPAALVAVVAVPCFAVRTSEARRVLSERIVRADAVYNLGRVGLLVAGFMRGDYSLLQTGMRDRLHQPERAALVPGMPEVLAAAEEAGALGAALSGAGPTLMALVAGEPEPVAAAMAAAWAGCGIAARTMVLEMAEAGVQVNGHGC